MIYEEKRYLADLEARLGAQRRNHARQVALTARTLAERYGADPTRAYFAGLLHDIFKDEPAERLLAFFERRSIVLTPCERAAPKLWHAMAGAVYLRETYGFDDDFINAVRYHTTGRAGMTTLEKILFTADFISADRDYPGVDDMRLRAASSPECAMEEGLRFTIDELVNALLPVHPDTLDAYNDIVLAKSTQKG